MDIRDKFYIEQISQTNDFGELNELLQHYIEDSHITFPSDINKVNAYARSVFESNPVLVAFKEKFKSLGISDKA